MFLDRHLTDSSPDMQRRASAHPTFFRSSRLIAAVRAFHLASEGHLAPRILRQKNPGASRNHRCYRQFSANHRREAPGPRSDNRALRTTMPSVHQLGGAGSGGNRSVFRAGSSPGEHSGSASNRRCVGRRRNGGGVIYPVVGQASCHALPTPATNTARHFLRHLFRKT